MINEIEIDNFRCFEHTKISGFRNINLIGGKNNAGKTCLLEAIYINSSPNASTINSLFNFRRESSFILNEPKHSWDYFFYNKNRTSDITISSGDKSNVKSDCIILSSKNKRYKYFNDTSPIFFTPNRKEEIDDELLKIYLLDKDSTLDYLLSDLYVIDGKIVNKNREITQLQSYSNYIPSFSNLSNKKLAKEFDKAELDECSEKVIEVINVIDPRITGAKTLSIGEPTLYLKIDNQKGLTPINLFGEAVVRVTEFILNIINNKNTILLIDEIENGIHYTNHQKLWQMLFRFSSEYDIQIFATTHSKEMLEAFYEAAAEENAFDLGAYFELAFSPKNKKKVGIRHKLENIKDFLAKGRRIRGE